MAIDEAEQDVDHQQADLGVFGEGEGEQRLQERAGQRRQHVGGLEARRHLERIGEGGEREGEREEWFRW